MHTGGLSHHFEPTRAANREWREQHPGLGLERRSSDGDGRDVRWTGGVMQDSRSFWGGYAGAAYVKNWRWSGVAEAGLGIGAYAFYRSTNWRGDMKLVPAVLPSASFNLLDNTVGMNVIYVPRISGMSEKMPPVLYTQLVVRFP